MVAGDGLRSVGVEDLPPTKSVCSILPTARHLRAGARTHPARAFVIPVVPARLDRGYANFPQDRSTGSVVNEQKV